MDKQPFNEKNQPLIMQLIKNKKNLWLQKIFLSTFNAIYSCIFRCWLWVSCYWP